MCRKSRDECVLEERAAERVRDKYERWLAYSNKVKPSFYGKKIPSPPSPRPNFGIDSWMRTMVDDIHLASSSL